MPPAQASIAGKHAEDYVRQNPGMPARKMARHLYHTEPKLFRNVEHARAMVRQILGVHGRKSRKYKSGPRKQMHRAPRQAGEIPLSVLPNGLTQVEAPLQISGPIKIGIISDLHIPFHHRESIEEAIRQFEKGGCNGIYINGDYVDAYESSDFQKDPRVRCMQSEIDIGHAFMKWLADRFQYRWWKFGNHEERVARRIAENTPELVGLTLPSGGAAATLEAFMESEQLGFITVDGRRECKMGKLAVWHGHELPRGLATPVNPARGLFLRTIDTALMGHGHRNSFHAEPSGTSGNIIGCWSIGCLCDTRPHYAVVNKWNHGAAMVTIDADGSFEVESFRIRHGKRQST
jgi:predicted phosphodiesterase